MGAMGYGLWTGPGDRRLEDDRTNFSRPQLIREIMVRNGDADQASGSPRWAGTPCRTISRPAHPRSGKREQQAPYAVKAYQRAQTRMALDGRDVLLAFPQGSR